MPASPLAENGLVALQWSTLLAATAIATGTDLRSRRIPNWLTGTLFLLGLAHAWVAAGAVGLLDGFVAALLLALPYVVLFVFAGGGAGDAKLMGGVGVWLGLSQGLMALMLTCLAGALFALFLAWRSGRLAAVLSNVRKTTAAAAPFVATGQARAAASQIPSHIGKQTMPYGPAIFTGVALTALGVLL